MKFLSLLSGARYSKYDKTVHVAVSFAMTLIGAVVVPLTWAAIAVFIAGIVKELFDIKHSRFKFDLTDIYANAAGVLFASLVWLLIAAS
ncbi:MAG: hypothetical protein A3B31_02145 [Candidatus Komeilibacteria bacterium RIFCSPLOWO2_01_FULL_53_11]|uniref:VanZ-like domain-containing protein n=1 Tax=Candidatus Komeilibacteria bacterium RIFCSPLOWO2_01_FULL_53_11 TaxID=1798552 RepID=A0A1G2BXT2_9BACT|nr:MAG: hypothetical protein A3B31_02145 [Candidatus Komeilibacteria bacterium RIFCSPLOWO2_01_FULL_53_11]